MNKCMKGDIYSIMNFPVPLGLSGTTLAASTIKSLIEPRSQYVEYARSKSATGSK